MGNPLRLLVLTVASIFVAELAVLYVASYLPLMAMPFNALIDAALLSVIVFPLLYLFYFRPMRSAHHRLTRINAELQLAETAFQESNEGMIITDKDNTILRINPAFTRITGYAGEEVIGNNPRLLSSGRHDRAFYIQLWDQVSRDGSWSGEIWNRRKSGEIFPEWLSIRAIKNEAGDKVYHMAVFSDITQRKYREERMRYQANYDPLTGLPNRVLFNDRLRQARELAMRDKNGFVAMFIDLDRFKPVNDRLGHAIGDKLLQEVAQRLSACVRNIDTVARFGGDEFTVILQEVADRDKAAPVARKIINALTQPFHIEGHEINISASIGIAYWEGRQVSERDPEELDKIIVQADEAMYQAKQSGRGQYCFSGQSKPAQVQASS